MKIEDQATITKNPPKKNVRTPAHNLVTHLPGLKGPARVRKPSTRMYYSEQRILKSK